MEAMQSLFNKYLLSVHYVSDTIIGTWAASGNKTDYIKTQWNKNPDLDPLGGRSVENVRERKE